MGVLYKKRRLFMSVYSDKLRNPKWQRKRLEVMQRDNFTCCLCGDSETELQVHHKSYEYGKEPHDYPLDNFQTLCKYCHDTVECFKKTGWRVLSVKKVSETGLVVLVEKDGERLVSFLGMDLNTGKSFCTDVSISERVSKIIVELFNY
jgi:hypothetical protein